MSIIFPVNYKGEYKAYFSIFDEDFKTYQSQSNKHSSLIIGATNPLFPKVT